MDGHPEVGADTLASALAAAPHDRAAAAPRRAWTGSRACSRTPRCACRSRRSSRTRSTHDAEELPSAVVLRRPHREWEPLRTKLGFVHHRLGNTLRPRGREPGYADAQALRRDLELVLAHLELAPRGAAARSGGCCGRSTSSASTSPASTSARARASCARRRARCCPATRDADEPRRQALLTEALASAAGAGSSTTRAARRASCCACSTPWRCRAEAYGPQAVPAFVISMTEQPSRRARRALARRSAPARPRCGWCRCSRRARRSSRRRRRWPSSTPASPTSTHLRSAGQPPDGDGRLLGLGQGHGLRRLARGRCTTRRSGSRRRRRDAGHRARALPRPRRLAVARRRAHLPRDPRPARGHRQRPDPDHRAGRDRLRALRRRRSSPSARWSRRSPPCCWPARCRTRPSATSGAPRWSGCPSARASATAALVYDDPEFLRFFGQVAPIAELSQLNIGSRPPSRKGNRGVESLRAIPWVFAWTQNRLLLPSWYGAGTALARRRPRAAARDVARLAVLPRADRDARDGALQDRPRRRRALPRRWSTTTSPQRFWNDLRTEYESVVERVLTITGQEPAARRDAGAAGAPRAPQPVDRPALAPPGRAPAPRARRPRGGARAAAGHDHRDRGGHAQHRLSGG